MSQWHPRIPAAEREHDLFAGYHDPVGLSPARLSPAPHCAKVLVQGGRTRQRSCSGTREPPPGSEVYKTRRICVTQLVPAGSPSDRLHPAARLRRAQEGHTPAGRDATPPGQRRGPSYRSSSTPSPAERRPIGACRPSPPPRPLPGPRAGPRSISRQCCQPLWPLVYPAGPACLAACVLSPTTAFAAAARVLAALTGVRRPLAGTPCVLHAARPAVSATPGRTAPPVTHSAHGHRPAATAPQRLRLACLRHASALRQTCESRTRLAGEAPDGPQPGAGQAACGHAACAGLPHCAAYLGHGAPPWFPPAPPKQARGAAASRLRSPAPASRLLLRHCSLFFKFFWGPSLVLIFDTLPSMQ
jgi:hypothetical protein